MNEAPDTGLHLRTVYEPEGGVRSVFSSKAADYGSSRPDYPPDLFATMHRFCGLAQGARVVDVGAGTGLLTKGLLQQGYVVTAVEPNAEMRREAEKLLGGAPGYRSVAGCAEAIPVATSACQLVTAAQAFHWFDVQRARTEFLRILVPEGKVAFIWNDRVREDPLHLAFDRLAEEFGGARRAALVAHEKERAGVTTFFGNHIPSKFSWPHSQSLDLKGLEALIFSRSYIPARDTPAGGEVANEVRRIFDRFGSHGTLVLRYLTTALIGRPTP